jgi:hypothetical protein
MAWKRLPDHAQVLAVHAAYMGFGKILYMGGDEHDPVRNENHQFDATCLFDCSSNVVTKIASPAFDVFCSGHAFIAASNIVKLLVAGGTEKFNRPRGDYHEMHFPGLRDAAIFSSPDFISPSAGGWDWAAAARMNEGQLASSGTDRRLTGGRWYPTLVTLPSGNVLAVSGHPGSHDEAHNNFIPEIFELAPAPKGKWRFLAQYSNAGDRAYYEQHSITLYPRLHVLPSGDILCTNPVREDTLTFQPDVGPHGGTFHKVAYFPPEGRTAFGDYHGSSVLLPLRHKDPDGPWTARAMICGGSSRDAYLLNLKGWQPGGSQLAWRKTGPRRMQKFRINATTIILPTGEILLCGGVNVASDDPPLDSASVNTPELYNPYTDKWDVADDCQVCRNYHSVALLMPDGRIWTAGSDINAGRGAGPPPANNPDSRNLDIEIFEPWYANLPGRPYINAAPSLAYPGETVVVKSTFADEITRVVLVRCGSCTHAFNGDQRMLELKFEKANADPRDETLLVAMPPNNNILVPGPYLIFTLRTPRDAKDEKVQSLGLPSYGTDIYIVPERPRPERPHG